MKKTVFDGLAKRETAPADSRGKPISLFQHIVLLSLTVLIFVLASSTLTYAWLSKNRYVSSKAIKMLYDVDDLQLGAVNVDGDVITLVDAGTTISTTPNSEYLIPGSTSKMKIGLANTGTATKTVVGVGFQDADIWTSSSSDAYGVNPANYDEIPAEEEGDYYYLGTELAITILGYKVYSYEEVKKTDADGKEITDSHGQPVTEMYITGTTASDTFDDMTPVRMTTVNGTDVTSPGIFLTLSGDDVIQLPGKSIIAFDIKIEFVDSGEEQNVYQNFGTGTAKFSRTLAIDVAE